jgi:hypothetical protein
MTSIVRAVHKKRQLPIVSDMSDAAVTWFSPLVHDDVTNGVTQVNYSATFGACNDTTMADRKCCSSADVTCPPDDDVIVALPEVIIVGILVSLVIVAIVVGNAFVVAAVAVYREMRTLTNWMIVSLASADLLVAIAVLPLSAYQVSGTPPLFMSPTSLSLSLSLKARRH